MESSEKWAESSDGAWGCWNDGERSEHCFYDASTYHGNLIGSVGNWNTTGGCHDDRPPMNLIGCAPHCNY